MPYKRAGSDSGSVSASASASALASLFDKGCLYGNSIGKFLEFDKNSSKWSYYSTDHKNYIKHFFGQFLSKLLDPQKSTFGDVILGIKLY